MGAAVPLRTSIVMDVAAKAERPLWSGLLSLPAAGMAGVSVLGRWLLQNYGLMGGFRVEAAVQVGRCCCCCCCCCCYLWCNRSCTARCELRQVGLAT
jgi:hypothetical protein